MVGREIKQDNVMTIMRKMMALLNIIGLRKSQAIFLGHMTRREKLELLVAITMIEGKCRRERNDKLCWMR